MAKSLKWLLEAVDQNRLVLPEMQRDFVWKPRSVADLFDSLYRRLPVGSLLIWKTSRVQARRAFSKKSQANAIPDNFEGYLLDGQQRLTALRLVRDNDPDFRLLFNVMPNRGAEQPVFHYGRGTAWSIPVAEVLSPNFSVLDCVKRLSRAPGYSKAIEPALQTELLELRSMFEREASVIDFESDDYTQAMRLFVRINSAGRRLQQDDLWAANLSAVAPQLLSGPIAVASRAQPGFVFTIPFLVKCLVAVHKGQMPKGKHVFDGEDEVELRASWDRTEAGIASVVSFLSSEVKWRHVSLVPSMNALIPLVYLASQHPKTMNGRNGTLARRWLLLSSLRGAFSSGVTTELNRILRHISKFRTARDLSHGMSNKLKKVSVRDFDTSATSGAAMSMFVSMLAEGDARDWLNPKLRLDGTVVGRDAKLHVHHFFPRALLRKHGWDNDWIDTFANYTVLSASTNYNFAQQEPRAYLQTLKASDAELQKQCIPLDRDLWRIEQYEEFLNERARLLADAANKFVSA